jgi:hypothetical protein
MAGKYQPLMEHLSAASAKGRQAVEMGFDEIADLVGGLPPSITQRQWWANTDHPQAAAWRGAGYEVERVYLDRRRVRFVRRPVAGPHAAARVTDLTPRVPEVRWDGARGPAPIELVDVRVGFGWQPVGAVVLDAGGKLRFPSLPDAAGLYRLSLNGTDDVPGLVYIGETESLRRRLAVTYRNPGPSQLTNQRVNAILRDHIARGGAVNLAVATAAVVHLRGQPQPLDLTRKASRLLAENAALVHAYVNGGADIVNLG